MSWGGYGGKATLRNRTILAMLAKRGKTGVMRAGKEESRREKSGQ